MILFDNIIFGMQSKGGVSRFWANLIDGVASQTDVVFFEHPSSLKNIYRSKLQLQPVYRDLPVSVKVLRHINFGIATNLKKRFGCDVFHSSYYRICKQKGVANITTVHDFMYEKFIKGSALWAHTLVKRRALMQSDCLVCISENTKNDLLEYYPESINKDIRVIPNGVVGYKDLSGASDFYVNNTKVVPQSYFLYVGHRGECKGFDRVYSVLNCLLDIYLVVVGAPFTDEEIMAAKPNKCADRIINVGMVSDNELNMLYSNAEFFFFPSLYEGFGLPPIEAMMSNCPVVTSSRSSISEVVGDAALLFDPDSNQEIESQLERVRDSTVRRELIDKGQLRADRYSWESVVDQYLNVYAEYSE